MKIVRAFIEKYLGNDDIAESIINEIDFTDESMREAFRKKLDNLAVRNE